MADFAKLNAALFLQWLKALVPKDKHEKLATLYDKFQADPSGSGAAVYEELCSLCGHQVLQEALSRTGANSESNDFSSETVKSEHMFSPEQQIYPQPYPPLGGAKAMDQTEHSSFHQGHLQQQQQQLQQHGEQHGVFCEPSKVDYAQYNNHSEDDEGMGRDIDSGVEGDVDNNEGDMEEGNRLQVSEGAKRAWNHCVGCNTEKCRFPLCNQVRPYVDHIRRLREQGIVGKCLEGCKYCCFFAEMKERIKPGTDMSATEIRRAKKESAKRHRLVTQFAGLLLAHKESSIAGEGDPKFRALLSHVVDCKERECEFRLPCGSCRSSQRLLMHLQECKAKHTKMCPLCNLLPPNVRRMKSAPRSLPTSWLVKREVQNIRAERQRARRREKAAAQRRNKDKNNQAIDATSTGSVASVASSKDNTALGAGKVSDAPLSSDEDMDRAAGSFGGAGMLCFQDDEQRMFQYANPNYLAPFAMGVFPDQPPQCGSDRLNKRTSSQIDDSSRDKGSPNDMEVKKLKLSELRL